MLDLRMFINDVSFSWDYFIKVLNFWARTHNLGQKIYEHLGYFRLIYQHLKKTLGKVGRKKGEKYQKRSKVNLGSRILFITIIVYSITTPVGKGLKNMHSVHSYCAVHQAEIDLATLSTVQEVFSDI